jgi:hypothetical protein
MGRPYVYGSVTNRETRKVWFCETDISVEEVKEFNLFFFMAYTKLFSLTMTYYRYAPLNDGETV